MAFTLRLLFLLRFLCFMFLVYLGLHIIVARLISRPDSKVLWFFSILTSPLTRPLQRWIDPDRPEPQRRLVALMVYGALWILITVAMQTVAHGLRVAR
jgi:uncharacterized membrane protein